MSREGTGPTSIATSHGRASAGRQALRYTLWETESASSRVRWYPIQAHVTNLCQAPHTPHAHTTRAHTHNTHATHTRTHKIYDYNTHKYKHTHTHTHTHMLPPGRTAYLQAGRTLDGELWRATDSWVQRSVAENLFLSQRHCHCDFASVFSRRVRNPQHVCPGDIERGDRRGMALNPVCCEENISRLDTRVLSGTAFKNVQEKPVLCARVRKAAQRCINRMLGKKLLPVFVVEGGMAAAELGQKLPNANLKLTGIYRQ